MTQMKRRDFMRGCAMAAPAALTTPLFAKTASQTKERPNILWLISEDTSPDWGCYGNPIVQTPNVDKFAAEGIRFDKAYITGPVCSAARSALFTGMYQTTIGAHQHRTQAKHALPAPVEVIYKYFQRAGYYTANFGKTDWNFLPGDKPFDGQRWKNREKGQPFFAVHNFGLTHRPFRRDEANPINPDTVKVPPYYPDCPLSRRDWADYLESLQVLDRQIGQMLTSLEQEGLADNTLVIYFGDHGRPHVRGKQWLYEGGIHIPLIARWPGKLKAGTVSDDLVSSIDLAPTCMDLVGLDVPKHIQGQVVLGKNAKKRSEVYAARDRCDETSDRIRCVVTKRYKYIRNFMPEKPYMQSNAYKNQQYPMVPLLHVLKKQGKLTPAQKRFMVSVRPKEELYDLQADPHEIRNLADFPKHADLLKEMRGKLDKWIKDTNDKGEIPETKEELAHWNAEMAKLNVKWMKAKGLPPHPPWENLLAYWEKKYLK